MRTSFLLILISAVAVPVAASAQTNSLFGSGNTNRTGSTSNGNVGTTNAGRGTTGGTSSFGSNSSGGGASMFGNSGFGNSNTGGSGFGNSGTGGSAFGNGGFGAGMQGTGMQGMAGQTGMTGFGTGNSSFIGQRGNTAGQLGVARAGQQGTFNINLGGGSGFQGLQRGGDGANANRNFNQGQGGDGPLPIRPTQRIAFDYEPITAPAAAESASSRLATILDRKPELAGVTVTSNDNGDVVLTGTVESENAARLAESFVRFEPGVRKVVNELTVAE